MPESEKEKEEEEDLLEEEKKRRGGHPSEGRVQMCSCRVQKDKREKVIYLK